jgi:hypothetical protein
MPCLTLSYSSEPCRELIISLPALFWYFISSIWPPSLKSFPCPIFPLNNYWFPDALSNFVPPLRVLMQRTCYQPLCTFLLHSRSSYRSDILTPHFTSLHLSLMQMRSVESQVYWMILRARLRDYGMYYNLSLCKQVVTSLSAGELKKKLSKDSSWKGFLPKSRSSATFKCVDATIV